MSSTWCLLLLLLYFCPLGRMLEVKGQEQGYLQEALRSLNLPVGPDNKAQLQKNRTGVLITTLLQAVRCAERTGSSQDMCEKVTLTPVLKCFITKMSLSAKLSKGNNAFPEHTAGKMFVMAGM